MTRRRIPEKPKVGKPSKGAAGLSRVLSIKISDELHAQWTAAAAAHGISLGQWIREAADLRVRRER